MDTNEDVTDDGASAGAYPTSGDRMSELIDSTDWSLTPLGPRERWPQSLKTALSIALSSRFPMIIYWGPRFCVLYNDAYAPIFAKKHPYALGKPGSEAWGEIWDVIHPMLEAVVERGEATWSNDEHLALARKGYLEECYFTWSFSPIVDETGGVGGVFTAVTETTERVLSERRLEVLRALGENAAAAKTVAQAYANCARIIERDPADVPFALFYRLDARAGTAKLECAVGVEAGSAAAPREIERSADAPWPLRDALTSGATHVVTDLAATLGPLPGGPWPEPANTAVMLPVAGSGTNEPFGLLVAGTSPRRELDDAYLGFLALLATNVGAAAANALAHEAERRRILALAEIDRAKSAFFSNVSHEFRTPLTLMLGPQEEALASPTGALTGDELRSVHRNTLRLLKLVNALLDFSRIEAGRMQACYEPVDLAALTLDLASSFRAAIERGGLRFDVACEPLPEPVYVDRDLWEKIVLNLLSNAFKFTFEGAISVTQRAAGDCVELEIADTGVGIPAHAMPRLFERFHRIEGTRARTHEGSGIGLALVRDLVTLHGGTVTAQSRPGAGSTFTVRIPFGRAHLTPEHVEALRTIESTAAGAEPFVAEALRWLPDDAAAPAARPEAAAGGDRVVLVVDDNADMRDYLRRLLGAYWAVETASDGLAAIAAIRRCRPSLVLTDVMMPNLDGFGLLAALRADPATSSIPVIMLSARAEERARVEGLEAGADDYLVKPFSAKELVARASAAIGHGELSRAQTRERDRLRALLGQMPAVVNFLRGRDLVLEYVHPLAASMLGLGDVLGRPLLEAMPELADQEFPALLRRVIETGRRVEGKERLVRRPDETGGFRESYWNFVYLPVRDDRGRIEGVMTFELDVTEQVLARRRIEEQAAELAAANRAAEAARAQAEEANRAKDEFIAMLGHELRNPLAPILTAAQLLRMRGLASQEIEIIERQVKHLVRLVDDLLDVSRVTRGKIELKRQPMEVVRAALASLEMARPQIEQREQRVELDVPPHGLRVNADPARLAQVISNLLGNAAKFSDRGTTIRLAAARHGNEVRIAVRDEGLGISAEMLEHVFDPFVQQSQSSNRAKGGLGLGLAIVKSLVELHGGRVEARSEGLGKGSEFVVSLPVAEEPVRHERRDPPQTAPLRPAPGKDRVLVVDDNVDAAEGVAQLLRAFGFEVEVAHDAQDALTLAKRFGPAMCLLDIGLPVMDGYELAANLRESGALPPDARIIALSGYGPSADREHPDHAAFDAHLVKPVTLEVLASALR